MSDLENASPFKCIHGFALSLTCGYCDEEAQRHRDGLAEWQRLQNEKIALMGVLEDEVGRRLLLRQTLELRASLTEMVDIYWGDGDGIHPAPACIQRAWAALEGARQMTHETQPTTDLRKGA